MNKHLIPAEQADYFNLTKKTYRIKGVLMAAADPNLINKYRGMLWIDDTELLPEDAYALRPFYECDFEWGDKGGLSSFTTALAICLRIFKEERIAQNLYEFFKETYIQQFPNSSFEIEIDISQFLQKYVARLHPYLHSRFCYSALIDSREILLYKHPLTGLISVNLAENYATHNGSVPDGEVRRLNERKQRLLFRLFAKDKTIITGLDFSEVMDQVEEVMSKFYWKSLERLVSKQVQPFLESTKHMDIELIKGKKRL